MYMALSVLCAGQGQKFPLLLEIEYTLCDGFIREESGDEQPSFNDPPERGQLKCSDWGEHLCWLTCAFHPTVMNRKQFSSSEELLQTSRDARGLRDFPVHLDSCQEQWQQWEGQ